MSTPSLRPVAPLVNASIAKNHAGQSSPHHFPKVVFWAEYDSVFLAAITRYLDAIHGDDKTLSKEWSSFVWSNFDDAMAGKPWHSDRFGLIESMARIATAAQAAGLIGKYSTPQKFILDRQGHITALYWAAKKNRVA